MEKCVELLAPAGNYEAFLGAVNAGADAVYLGGNKFSARAYADNFTVEEICHALHIAHFYGKKIYLTVNTLIKDNEFEELYEYLVPVYEAGLDGIIVQDLGVCHYLLKHFDGLAIHASTQMNITGSLGAAFMKESGVKRIVPARELSFNEIKALKRDTGLEIECFVHGAMCYCYSGQCLFSSILGGRSGNRGQCAQPCRLPYSVEGGGINLKESYPLSLKDMCTLEYLPKLIGAGIDSFKIEGRMKKPEYTAGVTALYRKYIDLYYEKGAESYQVSEEDMDFLKKLYIRSEIQTGYYERHNGKEMVTLKEPGYLRSDESILSKIREKYIHDPVKERVKLKASLKTDEPFCIQLYGREVSVSVSGETVTGAKNAPLCEGSILKQLLKTGNSCLMIEDADIMAGENIFLPVAAMNALRREAVTAYENAVITKNGLICERAMPADRKNEAQDKSTDVGDAKEDKNLDESALSDRKDKRPRFVCKDCLVTTLEQFFAVLQYNCRRIYIESDLYEKERESIDKVTQENTQTEWFLALPYVLRQYDKPYLDRLTETVTQTENKISGFLVRNPESLAYATSLSTGYKIVTDAGLYCYNTKMPAFLERYVKEYTLPYELNAGECRHLAKNIRRCGAGAAMIVYGRIPMMITANCLYKTADRCHKKAGDGQADETVALVDRYQAAFPVMINCRHCYNVIYNSVPYSLHRKNRELSGIDVSVWRYDFTMETKQQVDAVLSGLEFPFSEYTTGHFKRGVS